MIIVEQNPYKSVIVQDNEGEEITISEGNRIQFCLESGEIKHGTVTKLQGKDEKLKIQMLPSKKECEEIWPIAVMAEGSLKLDNNDEK